MMTAHRKECGEHGEQLVATMLERRGYRIIARNYRKKCGEIDLIAGKQNEVIFVEVKLRNANNVDLAELIGFSKQRKISAAARVFIFETNCSYKLFRCDVALVDLSLGKPEITYIEDAFHIHEGF